MSVLIALLDGRTVGTVVQERGRRAFVYADSWRDAPGAYPLSLSMPLAAAEHAHAAVEPYLWGLLPDNERILERWGQRFHVSARNPFALLSNVGEDCAGAVQFVRPERLSEIRSSAEDEVEWLTEDEVAARLRALQADGSAWRIQSDTGQFSLAGGQPKTALVWDGRRWGVPAGRTATTHILKPQMTGFDGHAENEHLCLSLAASLGLPTARTELRRFDGVAVIVVERYDRVRTQDRATGRTKIRRVHQEDLCQALKVHPIRKYQNEGGPGAKQVVELLRAHVPGLRTTPGQPSRAETDVASFLDALVLNWLIGGTDAHGKNYSILIGAGGRVRLAPLYDVASILPYPDVDTSRVKLAMKIGDEYRLRDIGFHEWRKLAKEVRVDADELIARIRRMAAAIPDLVADEARRMRDAGLSHRVIDDLVDVLSARARGVPTDVAA